MADLSLIIPCYNEAPVIAGTLSRVTAFLAGLGREYEIVVGDDGSDDGTAPAVREAGRLDPRIRLVRSETHRGKGAILTDALLAGRGDFLAFIDADLEIGIASLAPILAALDAGADVAIGSKVIHPDWNARPLRRRIATRGYNLLVRSLLGSGLADHQAGIKAFRAGAVRGILAAMRNPRWTWDTEFLIAAQSAGLVIREVPVTTVYQRPSKVSLIRQPMQMAAEVIRLFGRGVRVSRPARGAAPLPGSERRGESNRG